MGSKLARRSGAFASAVAGPDTPWPRAWAATAAALLVIYVLPYALPGMVPLLDLPAHLGVVRLRMEIGHGGPLDAYFVAQPRLTSYLLGYSILGACCRAFGMLGGARAYLALMVLAFAAAVWFLAGVLRANRWAALGCLPFALHYGFLQGFVNWIPAVPLLLVAVGLAFRQAEAPTVGRTALLLAIGTALLLATPLASLAFFVAILGAWLIRPVLGQAFWLHLLPLFGTLLPFEAINGDAGWMVIKRVSRYGLVERLERSWDVSTLMLRGHVDDAALGATCASLVLLAAVTVRRRALSDESGRLWRLRHMVLPAVTWLAVARAPMYVNGNAVAPRMMTFAFVFTLLGMARGLRGWRVAVLAPGLAASFVAGALFLSSAWWFQRGPGRDLERVIEHLPEHQAVLPLIDRDDPGNPWKRGPYAHLGQYALALRGAAVPGSFARLPMAPVRYKKLGTKLTVRGGLEGFDARVAGTRVGWLLARQALSPADERAFRDRHGLRLQASAGAFWLYEIPGGFRPPAPAPR